MSVFGLLLHCMTGGAQGHGHISYELPTKVVYGVLNTLRGVNVDDARVAMEMNFDRQNRRGEVQIDTSLEILETVEETIAKIRDKKLHGLSTTTLDFLMLREEVEIQPSFVASGLMETPLESYLLLAQKGVVLQDFVTKENDHLLLEGDERLTMGTMWLDTDLFDKKLPRSRELFNTISFENSPMRLILPVFFGKADACLISESAYETMVELNPQIGHKIDILLRSPSIIRHLICIVNYGDLDSRFVAAMQDNIANMHNTVDGKQLLTIFRLRRNFEYIPPYLESAERVLKQHRIIYPGYLRGYSKAKEQSRGGNGL